MPVIQTEPFLARLVEAFFLYGYSISLWLLKPNFCKSFLLCLRVRLLFIISLGDRTLTLAKATLEPGAVSIWKV